MKCIIELYKIIKNIWILEYFLKRFKKMLDFFNLIYLIKYREIWLWWDWLIYTWMNSIQFNSIQFKRITLNFIFLLIPVILLIYYVYSLIVCYFVINIFILVLNFLKFILWFDETERNIKRIERAKETISVGKLSGAVGTYSNINPKIEELICKKLGLRTNYIIFSHYSLYFLSIHFYSKFIFLKSFLWT